MTFTSRTTSLGTPSPRRVRAHALPVNFSGSIWDFYFDSLKVMWSALTLPLHFLLLCREWPEHAQRRLAVTSQSELAVQHHAGFPGFPSQLWHRQPHGLRHHQDPQPQIQRVSQTAAGLQPHWSAQLLNPSERESALVTPHTPSYSRPGYLRTSLSAWRYYLAT